MGLAGLKRLSTRNCRYGRAVIEKRRTDPDAEFLGGSSRDECSPENRNGIYEGWVACFPGKPMHCTSCGSENPDSKRFCGDRGLPLGSRAVSILVRGLLAAIAPKPLLPVCPSRVVRFDGPHRAPALIALKGRAL
jgi:hypothetical protein